MDSFWHRALGYSVGQAQREVHPTFESYPCWPRVSYLADGFDVANVDCIALPLQLLRSLLSAAVEKVLGGFWWGLQVLGMHHVFQIPGCWQSSMRGSVLC
jgi:hypothetical protein